jgi:hypothetical protein
MKQKTRKQSNLPNWLTPSTTVSKNSVLSHGLKHDFSTAIDPFSNTIDKNLINIMTSDPARSNKFSSTHNGKHILFAGCSVTEPRGINPENGWAQKTFNEINKKEKLSGFYNIALGGASIALQVSLIFKYLSSYGIPEIIFFNMPGSTRTFSSDNKLYQVDNNDIVRNGKIINSTIMFQHEIENPGSMIVSEFINFEMYRALHEYAKMANIKLISFSWADSVGTWDPGVTETLFYNNFNSFYKIDNKDFNSFVSTYITNNQSKTLFIASDNAHPGDAEHAYFAYFALKIYNDLRNSSQVG